MMRILGINPANIVYHLLALAIFIVWGSTFISTRVLLDEGASPTEIFAVRVCIAYFVLLAFYRKQLGLLYWRDEIMMALLGVMGGSFFFFVQNTALLYTDTSNVALLVCTAPLLTALLAAVYYKGERVSLQLLLGAAITLLGIILVIFNGQLDSVGIRLKGDVLAFLAAVAWAVYQLAIKSVSERYEALLITRKVFFYGLITILPYFLLEPSSFNPILYTKPIVWGNVLFLALVASLGCFWLWTLVVKRIGSVRSAYYIYLNPIVAMIAGYLILDEGITSAALWGTLLVIGGVFLSEYKSRNALEEQ